MNDQVVQVASAKEASTDAVVTDGNPVEAVSAEAAKKQEADYAEAAKVLAADPV
jgi:hypothetical protein